jgi:hypothetical protein
MERKNGREASLLVLRRYFWAPLLATALVGGLAVIVPMGTASNAAPTPSRARAAPTGYVTPTIAVPKTSSAPIPAAAASSIPATPVAAAAPAAAPAPTLSVASLVSQVEAAGIVPPPTWSWSLGDTATSCGVTSSVGGAAGCTSWSSGVEHTVFSGSPGIALVAHEVANAEVEQYAIPGTLQQVSSAAAGTSWSPTDAVASCLVEHFMGFQDGVAGSWQCPAVLAATVAAHIHDTIVTTRTTAVCGASSGIASTLTFTASSGSLTVTSPTSTETATAGVPVTVSGVGTFIAADQGGTPTVAGVCEG